jgi:23S rRNA (uridine2552-2'-O)-methyltransferase
VYQRKDAFYTRAKAAGYRSRAAFKLLELAQRNRLFRHGDHVVDLGAWPGGWLQVASELVGPSGVVVGVDLQPIDPLPNRNVVTLVGDITADAVQEQIVRACHGRVDVILSDLAPKLSGVRARDQAQSRMLSECAAVFADKVLNARGKLVMKVFMSDDLQHFLGQLRERFASVRTTRPDATRKGSAEIYVIATDYTRRAEA